MLHRKLLFLQCRRRLYGSPIRTQRLSMRVMRGDLSPCLSLSLSLSLSPSLTFFLSVSLPASRSVGTTPLTGLSIFTIEVSEYMQLREVCSTARTTSAPALPHFSRTQGPRFQQLDVRTHFSTPSDEDARLLLKMPPCGGSGLHSCRESSEPHIVPRFEPFLMLWVVLERFTNLLEYHFLVPPKLSVL